MNKDITTNDVFYIRDKVKKLMPTLRANPEYDAFKEAANDSELLAGIDNEMDIDDDMAHQLAKETWLDILQEKGDNSESILTFKKYLDLIQANAKGFVYELARDVKGNTFGVVWQTATMRANFERFGSYISLDTMKSPNTSQSWL